MILFPSIFAFLLGVFNHSTAIVNLEKIITVLFRGMRERREEEKKIEERRRAHDSCSSSLSGTTLESKDSDADQEKSIGAELTHEQLGLIAATTKAQPASLSKVCEFFFSKQLDKTEQVSTWNVRPLSKSQVSTFRVLLIKKKTKIYFFSPPVPSLS